MKSLLELYLSSMTNADRQLFLGRDSKDPLRNAFDKKRVNHAKVQGEAVIPEDTQKIWQDIMLKETVKGKRAAYLHIPFCQTKCLYCGFFQNYYQSEAAVAYVDCLVQELKMAAKDKYLQKGEIHTVFIGGGTPSSLPAKDAARLLDAIRECLPLVNDYELTLEGRVHDLTDEKLEAWFEGGVNRISIGVQSFQTKLRQQLGRIDSCDKVRENLERAASYDQCSVVVDLIYGLPDQDMFLWGKDLQILDELPIDGMDLYQLNVYENSVLKMAIDQGRISPAATKAQQAEMFAFAHEWLSKRPYKRLSNCHWGKTNRERNLYNVLAKSGVEMFPFGSGGGGKVGDYRCMLQRDTNAYQQMVRKQLKPLMSMQKQQVPSRLYAEITAQLEQGHLDIAKLAAKYGGIVLELHYLLTLWEERGLVRNNGVMYVLTVPGQFWVVNLTQTILESCQFLFEKQDLVVDK